MKRFTDKVALVTGGHSGIGFAIAKRFAAEGASLILLGRNHEKGMAAVEEIGASGSSCTFLRVDASSEEEVVASLSQIDRLDVLVNNAGQGTRRTRIASEDKPGTRWDRWRGPNLDATYLMTAHSLPLLRASGGCVVNISSTATVYGNWGLYGVAKAGVEAMTRSFATEATPVRVNAVSPGWIATEVTAQASGNADGSWDMPPSLFNRMGTGEEIAGAVAFLASDDASFVTGQTLIVDGGLTTIDYPSRAMLDDVGDKLFSGKA